MPQRHSKNNNDLAVFTYDERRRLNYGTQKERLGKEALKPFDDCSICLHSLVDPMSCHKGHLFCRGCIIECLVEQKKEIKRRTDLFKHQQQDDKLEEKERTDAEREAELEAFDRQNHGAVPLEGNAGVGPRLQRSSSDGKGGPNFHGASSVKTTSFQADAVATMKAFWLPSMTPGATSRVEAPSTDTLCPEGREKLRLKDLFSVEFTRIPLKEAKEVDRDKFMCPSCATTLTNTTLLVAVVSCGHVFCKNCATKFLKTDGACASCASPITRDKDLVSLEKGGTGYAGHDDKALVGETYKHVGSGNGQAWHRPVTRLR